MRLLIAGICLALLTAFTAVDVNAAILVGKSGLKVTTTDTVSGFGLTGNICIGLEATMTIMVDGLRGIADNSFFR